MPLDYWAGIADKLVALGFIAAIVFGIATAVLVVVGLVTASDGYEGDAKNLFRLATKAAIGFALGLSVFIFTPSSDMIMRMDDQQLEQAG